MKTLDGVARRTTWHEVRLGFSEEDAVAEAGRCLNCAVCADCRSCVEACPADAIDFEQKPSEEEITVGAVVIATGHKEFDAAPQARRWASGGYDNVLTQSQLARLLSASGPTGGELVRPSDGSVPQEDLHAAVRRLARLHLQRQRALLGDLLPVRHAAQLRSSCSTTPTPR